MELLKKIWEKLSGKKFTSGSLVLFTAVVLQEVVVGIWNVDPSWMQNVISTLNWVGMAATGTGALHKVQKGEFKIKKQ
jgi:hypothetical protein